MYVLLSSDTGNMWIVLTRFKHADIIVHCSAVFTANVKNAQQKGGQRLKKYKDSHKLSCTRSC